MCVFITQWRESTLHMCRVFVVTARLFLISIYSEPCFSAVRSSGGLRLFGYYIPSTFWLSEVKYLFHSEGFWKGFKPFWALSLISLVLVSGYGRDEEFWQLRKKHTLRGPHSFTQMNASKLSETQHLFFSCPPSHRPSSSWGKFSIANRGCNPQ